MKKNISILVCFLLAWGTYAQEKHKSKNGNDIEIITKEKEPIKETKEERRQRYINEGNPFKEFGYTPKIITLSNGKYKEFFTDSIITIGSFVYNRDTRQVTGVKIIEELGISEATLKPDVVSRWMSPDPLAEEFTSWSPYNFGLNNPIIFVDPDGRFARPFTDLFDKNGNKIGSDGVDNGVNIVVNNNNLVKQVKQVNKQDGKVDLLDDQFSFTGSDITILPSEATLKESINVLDRQVANGGLKEETSKVVDFGKRIHRSPTGSEPKIVSDGKGGYTSTASTVSEAAPLLGNERVTALIHSHPTKAIEKHGLVFPFSANNPTAADVQSFKSQQTNIIVGPISGSVTRNSNGSISDNRTHGISIFNSNSQLQISLPRKVVNKIIKN